MDKKRILICGTGFGKIYINAISKSDKYVLGGILGTGSNRTRELADTFGVPCYTDMEEAVGKVDAACVIVPNAAGGGNGANIACELLKHNIPTLLEHPAHEKEILDCLKASSKTTPFMLNPFYRYTEAVSKFIETARYMSTKASVINAGLNCAIHVLYDGLDMLGCALGDISTWELGDASTGVATEISGAGNKTINAVIGSTPTMVTVNTNVDRNDPDHPMHLYHEIWVTFTTGKLILVNTNGPLVWLPFARIPRNANNTLQFEQGAPELKIPSGIVLTESEAPSVSQTFDRIWTGAVIKALDNLFAQDTVKKRMDGQYQIFVSRLWSEICQKVGYANPVLYESVGDVKSMYDEIILKKENK